MLLTRKIEDNQNNYNSIFRDNNNTIIHELFNKNFDKKLLYAKGSKQKIIPGKQFCIDVIFKPTDDTPPSVITNYATIFCLIKDTNALALEENEDKRNEFEFLSTTSQDSVIFCHVDLDKWNYFSAEIDDNIFRVYINGQFIGKKTFKNVYSDNLSKLFISDFNANQGFFFGETREFRIMNTQADDIEIKQNWEKVKNISVR